MNGLSAPIGCIESKPTRQTVVLAGRPINLSEIAKKSGVDRAYLSRVMAGHQDPSLKTLKLVAASLGMDLESLLGAIEQRKRQISHEIK